MRLLFPSHDVDHVKLRGWGGISNGRLMALAEAAGFDVFITADQNLPFQQNLAHRRLAFLVLGTNRWATIRSAALDIAAAIDRSSPGSVHHVDLVAPPGSADAT